MDPRGHPGVPRNENADAIAKEDSGPEPSIRISVYLDWGHVSS